MSITTAVPEPCVDRIYWPVKPWALTPIHAYDCQSILYGQGAMWHASWGWNAGKQFKARLYSTFVFTCIVGVMIYSWKSKTIAYSGGLSCRHQQCLRRLTEKNYWSILQHPSLKIITKHKKRQQGFKATQDANALKSWGISVYLPKCNLVPELPAG